MDSDKVIFLYAEVTPYLLGCVKSFNKQFPNITLRIYYTKIFPNIKIETPSIEFVDKKTFKSKFDLLNDIKNNYPRILLISGRMESDYLFVSSKFRSKLTRVCLYDTIYTRSFFQILKKIFSYFLYKRYFDIMWGVGTLQEKFALDIGYNRTNIRKGFYVADKIFFNKSFTPKFDKNFVNFLYVGRLVKEKNVLMLAKVLDKINSLSKSNHKLGIVGDGVYKNKIQEFDCVEYYGLKTQEEIITIAKNYHAFCLPSIYEPWGVVLHEMAAIGLPIIASNKCGSSYDILKEGFNGFKFHPVNSKSLENSLNSFIEISLDEKINMSHNSKKMAKLISHSNWNKTLASFINS